MCKIDNDVCSFNCLGRLHLPCCGDELLRLVTLPMHVDGAFVRGAVSVKPHYRTQSSDQLLPPHQSPLVGITLNCSSTWSSWNHCLVIPSWHSAFLPDIPFDTLRRFENAKILRIPPLHTFRPETLESASCSLFKKSMMFIFCSLPLQEHKTDLNFED